MDSLPKTFSTLLYSPSHLEVSPQIVLILRKCIATFPGLLFIVMATMHTSTSLHIMTPVLCMLNLIPFLPPSDLLLLATFITEIHCLDLCQFVNQSIFHGMNSYSESNMKAYLRVIIESSSSIQAQSAGLHMSQQSATAVLVEPS